MTPGLQESPVPGDNQVSRPFQLRIRPMVLEDVEQVHAIDVLSFSLPWPERAFRYEVQHNPNSMTWVADVLDLAGPAARWQVAGAIVVWLIVDEAHIGTIAVHPAYRRLGIGKRLLAQALLESLPRGVSSVLLEVRRGNQVARDMYRKFGFDEVGVRARYYRDNGEDAILMTLGKIDVGFLHRILDS